MLPHAIGSTIGYVAKVEVVLGVISRQGGIEKQRLLTIPCQSTGVRQCVHFIEQIDIEIDKGYKKNHKHGTTMKKIVVLGQQDLLEIHKV